MKVGLIMIVIRKKSH